MGHNYIRCKEPITSWGIILVKVMNEPLNINDERDDIDIKQFDDQDGIKVSSKNSLQTICKYMNLIRFLLIRRKHSLGYIEFVRGRYVKDNIDGIIYLFQQMTPDEISKIGSMEFDEIWEDFWSGDTKKQFLNKKEYMESKDKFECLKNKVGVELSLDFYIKNVKPFYVIPEWGFPKGRKMRGESDLECAIREFSEETGYAHSDIKIVTNIKPIIENMIGTNGVSYRHIYYIAEDLSDRNPTVNENTEIGDIGFFSYEDADKLFREYHIEKKNITKNVFLYYLDMLVNKPININLLSKNETKEKWSTEIDDF
jgi:8-oxo-dGTP pyrophosphatase MutT (NUDIX family)